MEIRTLREIIQQCVHLDRPNHAGWRPVLCKICHDSGRKGKRAAFKFEGEVCAYNCFNCGHGAVYDPSTHDHMPHKMVEVLTSFGIPDVDWKQVLFAALTSTHDPVTKREATASIEPAELPLPSFFRPLTDDKNDEWGQYAIEYLRDERKIDWREYPYMVTSKTDHPDSAKWYGRLIIPIYKNNKLIFYQGRDLTDIHTKKYLNPNVARDNVLSGFDRLFTNTQDPLYVTEGWFDAYHIKGVAVFGNKMSAHQIKWLNQSHRTKVIIPDRYGDGYLLAEQALELGWSVSTPDNGDCKDVNSTIAKYGQLYTLKTIREHTYSGFEAETRVGIYCKRSKKGKK